MMTFPVCEVLWENHKTFQPLRALHCDCKQLELYFCITLFLWGFFELMIQLQD